MIRPLRMDYSDAFYHVLSRGIERREIFRDEQDQRRFTEPLGKGSTDSNWRSMPLGKRLGSLINQREEIFHDRLCCDYRCRNGGKAAAVDLASQGKRVHLFESLNSRQTLRTSCEITL